MDHKRRVALICASSKGLGKACAEALLKDQAVVVICSNDQASLDETKKELEERYGQEVTAILGDITKKEDVERIYKDVIDKFSSLNILVTNTPGPQPGKFSDLEEKDFYDAHDMLFMPVLRLMKLAIPAMRNEEFGRIINITSISVKEPNDDLLLSNIYRVGIVSLAKTLARESASDNVFINNVAPAAFKTDRFQALMESKVTEGKTIDDVKKEIVKNIPLGRLQNPIELGNLVSFLASDECFVTGATIPMDGASSKSLL